MSDSEKQYWETEKATIFHIGEKDFELLQIGPGQKKQLEMLSAFLEHQLAPILKDFGAEDLARFGQGNVTLEDMMGVIGKILNPDLYQSLGEMLLLATPAFVEDHFDVGWIIAAAEVVMKHNYGVRRLLDAFFSKGE